MTEKLRETIWIQPNEYLAIRNRCVLTVKMMMKGQLPLMDDGGCHHEVNDRQQQQQQQDQHCVRGLEGKTRDGSIRRKQFKYDSIAAVLEQQQQQKDNDDEDQTDSASNNIMQAYRIFSIPCALMAHETAKLDEKFVELHVRRCSCGDVDEEEYDDDEDDCQYNEYDDVFTNDDDRDEHQFDEIDDVVQRLCDVMERKGKRAAMLTEIERRFHEKSKE
jgi:hypothetical protein